MNSLCNFGIIREGDSRLPLSPILSFGLFYSYRKRSLYLGWASYFPLFFSWVEHKRAWFINEMFGLLVGLYLKFFFFSFLK